MCGRFVMLTRDEVSRVIDAIELGGELPSISIAESSDDRPHARPGMDVLAIAPRGQALEPATLRWGFSVEWSKKPLFNTRIETALSGSGMWREYLHDGRCIIPALAFFEPHATETMRSAKTGKKIKKSYRFASMDTTPLLMAGLTDGERCSVVTTQPNQWTSPIHPRMPLALRFQEVQAWLNGNAKDLQALADRSSLAFDVAPEERAALSGALTGTPSRTLSDTLPEQLSLF